MASLKYNISVLREPILGCHYFICFLTCNTPFRPIFQHRTNIGTYIRTLNVPILDFINCKTLDTEFLISDWLSTSGINPISYCLSNMETENVITEKFP